MATSVGIPVPHPISMTGDLAASLEFTGKLQNSNRVRHRKRKKQYSGCTTSNNW